jgi:hypothetical protein
MIAPTVNTYDRQWDEPEDAWTAFYRYRDSTTPRAHLDDFAMASGYALTALKRWWTKHAWASRLVAWDQRVDQARQGATLKGVEEMHARHIRLAKDGLECAELAIAKIKKDLQADFGRMKPQEVARLVEVLTKLERISRGEATERVDGDGPNYGKLSDTELQALEELAAKLQN